MKKLRPTKLEKLLTIDPRLGIILYDLELLAQQAGWEITIVNIKKYVVRTKLPESEIFSRTRIVRRLNTVYGDLGIHGQVAVLLGDLIILQIDHPSNRVA